MTDEQARQLKTGDPLFMARYTHGMPPAVVETKFSRDPGRTVTWDGHETPVFEIWDGSWVRASLLHATRWDAWRHVAGLLRSHIERLERVWEHWIKTPPEGATERSPRER